MELTITGCAANIPSLVAVGTFLGSLFWLHLCIPAEENQREQFQTQLLLTEAVSIHNLREFLAFFILSRAGI